MPRFGRTSQANLKECHWNLQVIFSRVIEEYDCSIIEGYRDKATQDKLFHGGQSKLQFPKSKHNRSPSHAVDAVPYPIDWKDTDRFYAFGGFVMGIAAQMGIKLRWGGDWDGDWQHKDQTFHDLPHFELVGETPTQEG